MLIANLVLFLAACAVLVISATFLVKILLKIGRCLQLCEFVAGFVIMAVATSLPELFVGISSALAHKPEFAFGNVIGANIIDLTLVVGIVTILGKGIKIKSPKTKVDSSYMFFICALPLFLMWLGHSLSRLDGAILLLAFALYMRNLFKERKLTCKTEEKCDKIRTLTLNGFGFAFCIALLFLSSKFIVTYASLLSIDLALPPILVGLFMISLGTTLPELTFESRAVLMGHSPMALGDLIGSVVVNSTLVLGTVALIYPITAYNLLFFSSGMFMLIIALLFTRFVSGKGNKLTVKEAIALILLYAFFVAIHIA